MTKNKNLDRAFSYAQRLLKIRERSEKELRDKLKLRGYPDNVTKRLIKELRTSGYIDDRHFARAWVNTKMTLRPSGSFKLRYELKQKGIDPEIIEEVLGDLDKEYDLREIALDLARRKISHTRLKDKQKLKQRLYAYLQRRTFSPEIIFSVMEEVLKDFE